MFKLIKRKLISEMFIWRKSLIKRTHYHQNYKEVAYDVFASAIHCVFLLDYICHNTTILGKTLISTPIEDNSKLIRFNKPLPDEREEKILWGLPKLLCLGMIAQNHRGIAHLWKPLSTNPSRRFLKACLII